MKRIFLKVLSGVGQFAALLAMSLAFGYCVCIGLDRQEQVDRIEAHNRRMAERWHNEEYLPALEAGRSPLTQEEWEKSITEGGAL